ncbi:MAG: response regulator [Planctomycetes bacterium]|nr:response regulator [Planctomycetota bacterium]
MSDAQKILVAEDDPRIRTILERFLGAAGYQVTACENGREALAAFDEGGPFDLVLTDVNMPEVGGEELLRQLKTRAPRLPVIVLTARNDPQLITELYKQDAYRYLCKPFTREDLQAVVQAALTEAAEEPGEERRAVIRDEDGWVELNAPNRQEYLDRFQAFCEALIASRLDERAKNELKIAVQELGQNAIEWGNRLDEGRAIRLSYKLLEDRILIRIADEGPGFDPATVPDPTVDPIKLIETRESHGKRPGGFGIHLARRVMDTVSYNETGNIVTMEKRFR